MLPSPGRTPPAHGLRSVSAVSGYLPFLVFGITTGSVYGLASMGLVLTYKTSGLFNFAHGAVGAAAAFVFYSLQASAGLPWPVAAAGAIGLFGLAVGLGMERLAAGLQGATTAYKIVATVGLLLAVRSLLLLVYGSESLRFEPFLPQGAAFEVSSVKVSYDNLIVLALGAGSALALYLLFRVTRLGKSMRAVVDDPALLDMTGASPRRVRRATWVIGSCFAAASGVLLASAQGQLDATLLSFLVVQAFGAAAIGAFSSLPLAYAGGLAVGLAQALISKEIAGHATLQGLDLNTPFLVLLAVLLLLPRRKLVELGGTVLTRTTSDWSLPAAPRRALVLVTAAAAMSVPYVVGATLPVWTNAGTQVLLLLSLGFLVRTSGQISLCHVGLAAVGAAAFGHALAGGLPWGAAVAVAGLMTVPVGALIAVPAIRLSGLYLGLATLGFGILLSNFFYTKGLMFGLGGNLATRRPQVLGLDSDRGYYYLVVALIAAGAALVLLIERTRLGRLLRAMADSPTALATSGVSVSTARVLAFCVSAFLAGISGAVFACQFGSVNGDSFPYLQSLVLLAVLAISGRATVPSALLASVLLNVVPGYVDDANTTTLLQVVFGGTAVIAALLSGGGLSARLAAARGRSLNRTTGPAAERMRRARESHPRVAL